METKEEAWMKFRDELEMSLPDSEGAIGTEAAARALAKAVLEEALAKHHPHTCGVWACITNDELRAGVDALGE